MNLLSLNGTWNFGELNEDEKYTVSIPGSVLSGLVDNQLIEDPYFGENEYEARDLFWKDYSFERKFDVSEELFSEESIELVCLGLDTISDIWINGKKIAHTENMHRTYRFSVKDYLVCGENEICIIFYSPLKAISEFKPEEGKEISVVPTGCIKGNQYIRKAHSMFGWDWGAQLPDCGIWRDIYLEAYSDVRIDQVITNQVHENNNVTLLIKTLFDKPADKNYKLSITITHAYVGTKRIFATTSQTRSILVNALENSKEAVFEIEDPKLWWPNDQGEQNLYNVDVVLKPAGIPAGGAKALEINKIKPVSEKHLTIGLRTITVSREKDEWGQEYALCVNGQKLFSMGADYIPEDCIYSRITREKQEFLIASAARAHYNTMRVWGGGYYPSDDFYDLCDKYGLVVWQDLMYACNVYDLTKQFEEEIIAETRDNVRRLRHHASLGFWCGNNEMESAWAYWGWDRTENAAFKADYIKMFEYILPKVIGEETDVSLYWPSSPSSGGAFDAPGDENRGDVHYWDVWHGQKPFTDYLKYYFRYCSEYGFQSFPSLKTVESYTSPEDRNIFSSVMESHQKNPSANGKMLYYLSENFKYPKDFGSLLYATQILQGIAVKAGAEHWRRHRGRCMGAIYWQINDNWPVASWASIDYFGRWKPLHYMAKRFFAPVSGTLLKIGEKNNSHSGVNAFVTNETRGRIKTKICVSLKDFDFNIIDSRETEAVINPYSASGALEVDYSELFARDAKLVRKVFVEAVFTYEFEDGTTRTETVSEVLAPYKYLELKASNLITNVSKDGDDYVIEISADTYTPFVWLELEKADAIFEDNCIDITNAAKREIRISAKDIFAGNINGDEDLKEQLQVRTLQSTYLG